MIQQIKVKLLWTDLSILPSRGTPGSAGLDLKAAIDKPITLEPRSRFLALHTTLIPCGFAIEIPDGYVGLCCPRSGLALKHEVTVANAPGVVDSDFRGQLGVILTNLGDRNYTVMPGERIAQLLIVPVEQKFSLQPVAELSDTQRGEGGWGHTGSK